MKFATTVSLVVALLTPTLGFAQLPTNHPPLEASHYSQFGPHNTLKTKQMSTAPLDYQVIEQEWNSNEGSFVYSYAQTVQYSSTQDTIDYVEYRFESGQWISNDFAYRMIFNDGFVSAIEFTEEDWNASCTAQLEGTFYSRIRCEDSDGVEYLTTVVQRESDYLITSSEDGQVLQYVSMVPDTEANTITLYMFDENENRTFAYVYSRVSINAIILEDVLELDQYGALPKVYIEYAYRDNSYVKIAEAGYIAGQDYDYEYWEYTETTPGSLGLSTQIYVDVDANNYLSSLTTKYPSSDYPSGKTDVYLSYDSEPVDVSNGPLDRMLGSAMPGTLQPVHIETSIEQELKEVTYQDYNSANDSYENSIKRVYTYSDETYDSGTFQEVNVKDYEYLFGDWAFGEYEETFRYQEDQFVFYRLMEENYLVECTFTRTEDELIESIVCEDNDQESQSLVFTYRQNDILITEKIDGETDGYTQIIHDADRKETTFISYSFSNHPMYGVKIHGLGFEDAFKAQIFDFSYYDALEYSMVEYYHNGQNWFQSGEAYWVLAEDGTYEYHELYEVNGLMKKSSVHSLHLDGNNFPKTMVEYHVAEEDTAGRVLFTFGDVTVGTEDELSQSITPSQVELAQNYPNPFNPTTQISFLLQQSEQIRLEVHNSTGQKIREIFNGLKGAGSHTFAFDAGGLASGVYYYTLTTPSFSQTKKMLLIK